MYTIEQANEYIAVNKKTVNRQFFPRYHMAPPVGWMNDPNGLVRFGGKYLLFYQFHPYDTAPGAMHWGSFVSSDLITYADGGVALCPTEPDETSCFSGGGIVSGGIVNLLYTRHYEVSDTKKEQVCLVKSPDGKTFCKAAKPVFDNETLPKRICRTDFRDPCPVQVGDRFYVFVGGRNVETGKGTIVVLSGNSLDRLEYDFCIGDIYALGDMAECPCYTRVGDKDVIIVSGCHVAEKDGDYKNSHTSVFIVGKLDFAGKRMDVELVKEIDKGDTFYAPQIISGAHRPIMIGWLEMWNKPYPTRELGHGWAGAFSLPRELSMENGELVQKPVAEIEDYLEPCDALTDSFVIDATLPVKSNITLRADDGQIVIGNDGAVYLDTINANNLNGCIRRAAASGKPASVRIFVDVSTVEVFAGGGQTISSRFYLSGGLKAITHGGATYEAKRFVARSEAK